MNREGLELLLHRYIVNDDDAEELLEAFSCLDALPCRRCHGRDKKYGCLTCGGSRVALRKHACDGCQMTYWVGARDVTNFVGLEFVSIDGLRITTTPDGSFCKYCHPDPSI